MRIMLDSGIPQHEQYNQRGTIYHACIVHNPKAHADTHACIRKQLDEQARERNRQNLERRQTNIHTSGSTTIREQDRHIDMTWKLRRKDSRCASISVTKEQEVWGEYGIDKAHKHKYLFKIIHKRHLKAPKKEVQTPPKSSPRHHLEPKITQTVPGPGKNQFWVAGSPIARAKRTPKWTSKRDQEHQNPRSICYTKKTSCVLASLEPTEAAFGG